MLFLPQEVWGSMAGADDPGVFYKFSTGLAATEVNPVLGIIGKNLENKTGKKTKHHYVDTILGTQSIFFFPFEGLEEITRGRLQKSIVSFKNNLKTTQYWKRGALNALAPTLFLHLSLPMAQSQNKSWGRGTQGLKLYCCSDVLTSVPHSKQWLITQPGQRSVRGT